MPDKKFSSVHYAGYLGLDKVLNAQDTRSKKYGEEAHDEMLFIIIHQVYELWFKQIIHEVASIVKMFDNTNVDERDIGKSVHRLRRVIEIQKVMISQIDVLETMAPLDFLEFRNYIVPASGFQSFQFRLCEIVLGLRDEDRMTYNGKIYSEEFNPEQKEMLKVFESSSSLFEVIENWLERTPFIKYEDFDFKKAYIKAVEDQANKQKEMIKSTEYISDSDKEIRIKMINQNKDYILSAFDKEKHKEDILENKTRLSYKATISALMISLYRDEPILRAPFNLIDAIVTMDEQFNLFRFRHAQMVMRILGKKMGTGGSSGHDYLIKTVSKHQIFRDFHNISTLMIPREQLPELPENIINDLSFNYGL